MRICSSLGISCRCFSNSKGATLARVVGTPLAAFPLPPNAYLPPIFHRKKGPPSALQCPGWWATARTCHGTCGRNLVKLSPATLQQCRVQQSCAPAVVNLALPEGEKEGRRKLKEEKEDEEKENGFGAGFNWRPHARSVAPIARLHTCCRQAGAAHPCATRGAEASEQRSPLLPSGVVCPPPRSSHYCVRQPPCAWPVGPSLGRCSGQTCAPHLRPALVEL